MSLLAPPVITLVPVLPMPVCDPPAGEDQFLDILRPSGSAGARSGPDRSLHLRFRRWCRDGLNHIDVVADAALQCVGGAFAADQLVLAVKSDQGIGEWCCRYRCRCR